MEFIKYICPIILFTCSVLSCFFTAIVLWSPERKATENRLLATLCLGSAIWSMGFGALFLQTDTEIAYYCRVVGMIGTIMYLIAALVLACHLSSLKKPITTIFHSLAGLGVIIYFLTVERSQTIYRLDTLGMTYSFKPGLANTIYTIYSVIIAVSIFGISIYMCFSKTKRIQFFGKIFLLIDAIVLFGTILDTVFPLLGMSAIPGSTITQFWGAIAAFIAIQANNRSKINITNMSEFIYYSLAIPVLVYDSTYTLKIANEAASKFFQLDQDALSHKNVTPEALFNIGPDELFCFTDNSQDKDVVCHPNQAYCNLSINKITDRYDDIIGYIIIVTDLSERMKNIQRLEEAKLEAESANRAKTAFLANMSHEIRTPMNAIMGFSELILKMDIPDTVQEYVTDIKSSSQNLLAIINDILDISKLDSGKMELSCANYFTHTLLQDVYLIIDVQARKKGLQFQMTAAPRIPNELYGDVARIRGVLINILNNAIKYTQKGSVQFNIRLLDMQDDKATLEYSIIDTGIGIKENALAHLFDSFSRFDNEKNSEIEGTGLGLSIVNGYVKLMGGTISVDSIYGVGSTFIVTLSQKVVDASPMNYHPAQVPVSSAINEEAIRITDTHVLVTDDNLINLKVIKNTLDLYGFRVDTAASGPDAIRLCSENTYDLIFMDQMMPHMDGVETMERIRALSTHYASGGACKIIALTANAISGVRTELLEKGFDEYMSKPISMDRLEHIIRTFVPASKILTEYVATQAHTPTTFAESTTGQGTDHSSLETLLPDVDIADGLTHCSGKTELYLRILQMAYESAEKQLSELQGFWDAKDYDNFTIQAHSLKGQLLNMGATELGDMARELEFASKEGRYDEIAKLLQAFVEKYRGLMEKVAIVLEAQ